MENVAIATRRSMGYGINIVRIQGVEGSRIRVNCLSIQSINGLTEVPLSGFQRLSIRVDHGLHLNPCILEPLNPYWGRWMIHGR
jgi:hypothetical protein